MDLRQLDTGEAAIYDDVSGVNVVKFSPGGIFKIASTGAITAFATGGQASATALTTGFNRLSTVATAADSVKLPQAKAGAVCVVLNNGVAAAAVFPFVGDFILNLAVNISITLPVDMEFAFRCYVDGTWMLQIPVRGAQYVKNTTVGVATAAAGDLTGVGIAYVQAEYSAVGAANLTTRTAAQMIADGFLQIGDSYVLEIFNSSAGTTTLVGGTGVTVTGTATLATATSSRFNVKVTGAATITITRASA